MSSHALPLIRLEAVTKIYRAGQVDVRALDGVSLDVPAQAFTMLVGPSGSGKTTLLNLMGCIDRPCSGRVEIAGVDIAPLNDDALSSLRANHIGFIFQSFSLVPVLSAYENIEYPLLLRRVGERERRQRVDAMLEAVGLTAQRRQRPNELSGGQKQRVAIARALVKQPQFVLADEPTANLDTQTGNSIIALMRQMQVQFATSFIFSTHDPNLISHADTTYTILDGRIVDHSEGTGA